MDVGVSRISSVRRALLEHAVVPCSTCSRVQARDTRRLEFRALVVYVGLLSYHAATVVYRLGTRGVGVLRISLVRRALLEHAVVSSSTCCMQVS